MRFWNRRCLQASIIVLSLCWFGAAGAQTNVISLKELSPLAGRDQITHRLLSPLARVEYDQAIARRHLQVVEQTIKTDQEHYDIFVPDVPAGSSWGVIVFIAPGEEFRVPPDWRGILAREHLILISARRSGNNQNMLERRVPLALHGYGYASTHYRIDPARVYAAGFSGGARTAQLVAFAYPDIFRGVLLFAGSDPFGEGAVAPPPRELMTLLQTRLRIVQSMGMADEANIAIDGRMRRSLADLCIRNVAHIEHPGIGHAIPRRSGFGMALALLLKPNEAVSANDQCNAGLKNKIDSELAAIGRLAEAGEVAQARRRLLQTDAHYGWLAAPASAELMEKLAAHEPRH